jgi:hypothetical protein
MRWGSLSYLYLLPRPNIWGNCYHEYHSVEEIDIEEGTHIKSIDKFIRKVKKPTLKAGLPLIR